MMKSLLALLRINLRLAFREKGALIFGLLFPLGLFLLFTKLTGSGEQGSITFFVTLSIMIGLLTSFLGAAVQLVQLRQLGVLRRYKAAPIQPAIYLTANLLTGWILYLPTVILMLSIAHFGYRMALPRHLLSLFLFITVGYGTFQSLGYIIASVSNTVQESSLVGQFLYLPMMFLSGFTFPITFLPKWAQILSQFLPGVYLQVGFQSIFLQNQTLWDNRSSVLTLLLTLGVSMFVSVQLFRWEKEDRVRASARLWVLCAFSPFLLMGAYQAYTNDLLNVAKIQAHLRDREDATLIRGARIFVGDGSVIEKGAVLIRNGKIQTIYRGEGPDPDSIGARGIEAVGKTLLPGLIDLAADFDRTGAETGVAEGSKPGIATASGDSRETRMIQALKSDLYCGVTAAGTDRSDGDVALKVQSRIRVGELLASEPFLFRPAETGRAIPAGTADAASPAQGLPPAPWAQLSNAFEGSPALPAELKQRGIDGIIPAPPYLLASKTTLSGWVNAGETCLPMLCRMEARARIAEGKEEVLLGSPLVQQVGSSGLLEKAGKTLSSPGMARMRSARSSSPAQWRQMKRNLLQVYRAGIPLAVGSGAGSFLVFHGPSVVREIELWVKAGIPASVALKSATTNAAHLLHAENRIGRVKTGFDADLLLVDGNPLEEITALEKIDVVLYQGERVDRSKLLVE